jgi:L-alanine-DL-glutamate epimerase-like enolase superfamily enzyme
MLITGSQAFPLRIPFRPGARSAVSAWGPKDLAAVDSLLVKVATAQGLEGWGEAFGFAAAPVTRRAIEKLIAPLCLGRDATRIAPLMRDVQETLHVFGRGGPLGFALSAVDIALWDIAGKAAGLPLHRLLGGGGTDVACYASMDAYADPALVRAGVRQALDAGFRSIKLHEKELPAVHAARDEAGPDVALMLDVNGAWTVNQAQAKAEELSAIRLTWLEEPAWPPENYDGLARLRQTSGIPVAAGENVPALMDFDRLMAAALGAADTMIEWRFFDLQAQIYGDALTPKGRPDPGTAGSRARARSQPRRDPRLPESLATFRTTPSDTGARQALDPGPRLR